MNKILIFFFFLSFSGFGQTPTWSDGVGKIIYENCTSCHRSGGIGPFPLENFQQASPMASAIAAAVGSKSMPPWTPDPGYTNFVHERVMAQADIDALSDWAANGAPEGDPAGAPHPPNFLVGSQLGTPDLTLTIPTYTVSSNQDVYRNFELPSGLAQAVFANAVEVVPGNSEIVHHVLVFSDSTNNPISPNSMGGTGSSASELIYGYTPGAQPYFTPVGTGFRLSANTRVILQVHYAPGSAGQSDATTVNFKTDATPQREVKVDPILNHFNMTNGPLYIPADQVETFNQQFTVPGNFTLLYTFPHMHLIGKSIRSWGNLPITGDTVRLIDIPKWDFHWQDNFVFQNAIPIPIGTVLKSEAVYDNTVNNPENPSNPPQNVSAGEGTFDEMMFVFFAYMDYQNGDEFLIIDDRIVAKGGTIICPGHTTRLETIQGTGYNYQWYLDGAILTGANNYFFEASMAGDYTVEITLGPNVTLSDPTTIIVNTPPVAVITPPGNTVIPNGGVITLAANTGTGYTYQWYLDGTAIFGATSDTYDASIGGDYTVGINNGCFSLSNVQTLTDEATSISHIEDNLITIYPNPFNSTTLLVANGDYKYSISDLTGKIVLTGSVTNGENKLYLQQLNRGMYILKLERDSKVTFIERIIKK